MARYFAGIDLGGTFVKCGIVDEDGNIIVCDKIPTCLDYEKSYKDMAELAMGLAKKANVSLSGIGIGSPGAIDSKRGIILFSGNLNWTEKPLAKDIEKITGVKTFLTNDANAAALGEYAYGAGKKFNSIVMVTLGTGVGGGIVFDGKLFEGNKGLGAELGHIITKPNGEQCTCGNKGCFETYASATALVKQARKQMLLDKESMLWELCENDLDKMNGYLFFKAVRANDKSAIKVLKKYVTYLASGIVSMANLLRPEAILIGGGISAAGDLITKPLQRKLNKQLFGGTKHAPVKIMTAALQNDAGTIGASRYAMDNI